MLDKKYWCEGCGVACETSICEVCRTNFAEEVLGENSLEPPTRRVAGYSNEIVSQELPSNKLLRNSSIKKFVLGGNATFTLHNTKKGTHLTYKVTVAKQQEDLFFVSILTGQDNYANYSYLGIIREGVYWYGRKKSKISEDAPSAKAFEWFWNNLDKLPNALRVLHEGKCGRCGRKLTVPESISSGFGPECRGYI